MLISKLFPTLASRFTAAKISGRLVRQGTEAASITSCALPNNAPEEKTSIPTTQVFNITGGQVHIINTADARGQSAVWDAVAMSPAAKALLQKHAVKASTALKMHYVLGFEDVDDLQHLSSGLIAQLKLKPLQLEPLARMLREHQQLQGQQQLQQGKEQPGFSPPHSRQQHMGHTRAAGHADGTPSPGAPPTAHASPLPAVLRAAGGFPDSADQHEEDAGRAVPAEAGMPSAAAAAASGAPAKPGADGRPQPMKALNMHTSVAAGAGAVNLAATAPDGRHAAAAGTESTLHDRELQARSCTAAVKEQQEHAAGVAAAAEAAGGRQAASGSQQPHADELSLARVMAAYGFCAMVCLTVLDPKNFFFWLAAVCLYGIAFL